MTYQLGLDFADVYRWLCLRELWSSSAWMQVLGMSNGLNRRTKSRMHENFLQKIVIPSVSAQRKDPSRQVFFVFTTKSVQLQEKSINTTTRIVIFPSLPDKNISYAVYRIFQVQHTLLAAASRFFSSSRIAAFCAMSS